MENVAEGTAGLRAVAGRLPLQVWPNWTPPSVCIFSMKSSSYAGEPGWDRTIDPLIKSQMLCR